MSNLSFCSHFRCLISVFIKNKSFYVLAIDIW